MAGAPPKPDRPRLLFVGRGAPWRGGAGYLVRQKMWLEAATRVADVTAVMFDLDPKHAADGVESGRCVKVVAVPNPPRVGAGRLRRAWDDRFSSRPRSLRYFDTERARAVIAALHPEGFDAVMVYRIDTASWAGLLDRSLPGGGSSLPGGGLLLDIDDPEHARTARRIEALGEPVDAGDRRDLARLHRFELNAASRARVAWVCQEADRDRFDAPRPEVAPNAVDVPERCPPYEPEPGTLLFVGNLTGGRRNANLDGLLWFLDEVWPRVLEARPGATLRIGGRMDPETEATVDAAAGVQRLGFVDDMAAEVRRAAVNLAPIRFGTGTRIKVLDALAQGGAVVATTLAVEGIDAQDGVHLRLADEPGAFAAACVSFTR